MTQPLRITRAIHIPAMEPVSVYSNPAYASIHGTSLIETVRHEALHLQPDGSRQYYERRLYRRRSDDNGRTWTETEVLHRSGPERLAGQHLFPMSTILDPHRNVLIGMYASYELDPTEPQFASGNRIGRTYRTYYQLSRDSGHTWTAPRQVIDERPGFNAQHWGPVMEFGEIGAVSDGQFVFLPDGTLVLGFSACHPRIPAGDTGGNAREGYWSVIYAQARWTADGQDLRWRFGQDIAVDFPLAGGGCCEAALAWLGGNRVFNTMRCQGDEAAGIYSTRYTTTSEDGGLTWTLPEPLRYEDGATVWTPAAVHRFVPSSRNGKTYLLTNILPGPVYHQTPRYPLTIAEFDVVRCRVLRDTVQVIQDLPPGAPVDRRYTNFGLYEERGTGDLILHLPEMPRTKNFEEMLPEDFGSDCIQFRVQLGD